MRKPTNREAFTLIELLTVIAIVSILAALLFPAVSRAKLKAERATCSNNLRQVTLALLLYADDFSGSWPVLPNPNPYPNGVGAYYKELIQPYVRSANSAPPGKTVFACPADQLVIKDVMHAFTSYTFNGYEVSEGSLPRITGRPASSIPSPSRAVLVGEKPAFFGGSWHPFKPSRHADAKNLLGFVDGHVSLTKIYWDGQLWSEPRNYEPPAGYDYSWSGN
ncbi:MAG TPA: prepilin-type N-terminal cleavage/methylation domain-containing protein [Methylomirabilota bacterium]|nr:prepilin-type N-terminal cleavage/methylation domain-containing protein [Methylomirabilota bacterium]